MESLKDTFKRGTYNALKKYVKDGIITDEHKRIIESIYQDTSMNDMIGVYSIRGMSVRLGPMCRIHNYIINYILQKDQFNSFKDFLEQNPKNSQKDDCGINDLVVPGMEERYIAEEYAPKDELKCQLPKPISTHEPFECSICMSEDCYQKVVCKKCNLEYCYTCCCQQARRTGKCPRCGAMIGESIGDALV